MKKLLCVVAVFLLGTGAAFSEKVVIVMDWHLSTLELRGIGTAEQVMFLVKRNEISDKLPDTIIVPGTRTADGWKFRFEIRGPEILSVRSNDRWFLDEVFVQRGDSLVFLYEGGNLACKGDGSYINAAFLNLLPLCPSQSGTGIDETTYEDLEAYLDACMANGMKRYKTEIDAESIPLLFRKYIRGMLYARWATPRVVYLCRMYYVQQVRSVPPSERYLRFLGRLPGDVFEPPFMKQFATFSSQLFQIYLGEAFYASGASSIDDIIIQTAVQKVRGNHLGAIRDHIILNSVRWLLDTDHDAAAPMVRYILGDFRSFYSNEIILDAALAMASQPHNLDIGDKAPDFAASDIDGNRVALSDLKGQPVLLYFWGTWCETCAKNLDEVRELVQRTKDLGVKVVLVANEYGDLRRWEEQASSLGAGITSIGQLAANDENIARQYDVTTYPSSVLINKYGYVIANDPALVDNDAGANRIHKLLE